MRSFKIIFFVLAFFTAIALCWTHEDIEIFEINESLKKETKDPEMNFYKYLNLPSGPKSSYDQISRAFKKLSRKYHPDKYKPDFNNDEKTINKQKKNWEKRFQNIGAIAEILRSENKDRYDFFYKNGFPTINDENEYVYNKYRPSFLITLAVIFVIISVLHFIVIKSNNTQQRQRIESLINEIKTRAFGNGTPTDFKDRKVYHDGLDKYFVAKFDGSVYLLDESHLSSGTPIEELSPEEIDKIEMQRHGYNGPKLAKGVFYYKDDTYKNRRTRRSELKHGSDEDEDVLLQMSVDEVPLVTLKDMLFIRFLSSIYNTTLERLIPKSQPETETSGSKKKTIPTTKSKDSTTEEDFEILNLEDANPDSNETSKSSKEANTVLGSKTKKTSSGEKKVLPNGQVIYSRKK
ncbi:hypothetical protein BVG19_g3134 [[Candida] boidinii]|nr:hypothetical protein BVG19_g3134 [[Candida] boidinii]OWB50930.1 hypothetical protein B5S27_g2484 [[Candida] boidinii]